MKNNKNNERSTHGYLRKTVGITLVALVVTIVVLIILATISINIIFGEEGILTRARQTKDHMSNAEIEEQTALNEMYKDAFGEHLPENTKDTDAGTIVKTPSGWYKETPVYVSTEDGSIVKASTKVASVYAVATGNGETVPVPKGFYYVGGTIASGVVISDKEADKNKYAGQADVPSGISVNDDGELERQLQGDQFVWIPCTESEYKKSNVWNETTQTSSVLGNINWETTTNSFEIPQIQKYGGFYVGRYEAGLDSDKEEYENGQDSSSSIYNEQGVPQSKAGVVPWIYINWTQSQKNSQNMYYSNDYVFSGLITGTQWDVMINKIGSIVDESGNVKYSLTSQNIWGNYYSEELSNYIGRYATYDASTKKLSTFSSTFEKKGTKEANKTIVLSTGASEVAKAYNIYDVAGNVWEWTEEAALNGSSTQYKVFRGGSYIDDSATYPVCFRYGDTITRTNRNHGFRVVLYMR